MRKLLSVTTFTLAALANATCLLGTAQPAAAETYTYCRRDNSYMLSCSFETLAQCQASASGRGGECSQNPFLPYSAYAYAPKAEKNLRK